MFSNHSLDFQLHILSLLTVQLFEVVVRFVDIGEIVDQLLFLFARRV